MNVEQVWADYKSRIEGFLHSKVSNAADVDDLLQDILIKTHAHLQDLREEEKLKPWLFRVANNAVIDYYRKQGRTPDWTLEESDQASDSEPTPHLFVDCLHPFINALPAEQSTLLRKIDIDGLSQKDVATELNLSYSTLKSRVQKARQELKRLFSDCCKTTVDRYGNVVDYTKKDGCDENC